MELNQLGLNDNMTAVSSPLGRPAKIMGATFDQKYDIQGRSVIVSNFVNNEFIKLSNIGTTGGTIGIGLDIVLSTTLDPTSPPRNYYNFGIPFFSIYESLTAVGSMEIYPRRGSGQPDSDKFHIMSGFSWNQFTGTNSDYEVVVQNNTGSAVPYFAVVQWKYTEHGRPNI
jgi:hypothetical protein